MTTPKKLPAHYHYLAPDSAEVRLLLTAQEASRASMAHCLLPPLKVSLAAKHRSVEELWYFTKGKGEMWLKSETGEITFLLTVGVAITIAPGTTFQYRNLSTEENLEFVVTTIPHWPGEDEAILMPGKWAIEA